MRLIDADALKKESIKVNLGNEDYPLHESIIYESDVDEAPTIDAAPVVHAKWEYVGGNMYAKYHRCTNCTAMYDFTPTYCPNCGAKMDKEKTGD